MNRSAHRSGDLVLIDAAVPAALVADAARFGGAARGDCLAGDLLIAGGRVAGMLTAGAPAAAERVELGGRIVISRLAEPHVHLDKCHTVARMGAVGGDLHAAIAAQHEDKRRWTPEDIRRRAARGIGELHEAGCGAARSHVDWTAEYIAAGAAPPAWDVLGELAAEWSGRLTLQRAALLGLDSFADRRAAEATVRIVARSPGAALGAFVFDQPEKRRLLTAVFELAEAYGLALDFHVDEGLGAGLDGLATIAELAAERGFRGPLLCGHACSLSNLEGEPLRRAVEAVAASGMSVATLPTTNLYLQDRRSGSPQRRGLTRVRELAAAGVSVLAGSDNVGDAFCPLGRHDPLAALGLAALAGHLDPPYGAWLPAVTTAARRALGLAPLHVDEAAAADLLVSDATHTAALVAGAALRPLTYTNVQ